MDLDLSTVISQGPWAALSVFLLYRIFKKNDSREKDDKELLRKSHDISTKHQEINELLLQVVSQNQKVITSLVEKYESLQLSVDNLSQDVKEIYKTMCKEVSSNDQ
jgi:hypothetical protein